MIHKYQIKANNKTNKQKIQQKTLTHLIILLKINKINNNNPNKKELFTCINYWIVWINNKENNIYMNH